jgi:RsiW-degrading membrane proteinase PrsW (M82 family)
VAQVAGGGALLWVLLGSLIPVVGWLAFFYSRDRYDPEPKGLLFRLFLIGALPVAIAAGALNGIAEAVLGAALIPLVVAPLVEETLKFVAMTAVTARHRAFDEPIDGMIYGSTVGLGFAATENILYLFGAYLGVTPAGVQIPGCAGLSCVGQVAFVRGTGSAVLHALATGVAGYVLARRIPSRRPWSATVPAVLAAAALHALWNALFYVALVIPIAVYVVLARRSLAASPFRATQLAPRGYIGPARLEGQGPLTGHDFRLGPRTVVGRRRPGGPAVDMDLAPFSAVAPTVTLAHAELWRTPGSDRWFVRPLVPDAPTWLARGGLGFSPVPPQGIALHDGDALAFGQAVFLFRG